MADGMSDGVMDRAAWLDRLAGMLAELQPELGPVALAEDHRLGEDLGLDSLAFEALFARLREALGTPIDAIAWLDALEEGEGRVGVLLDLIAAHAAGDPAGLAAAPGLARTGADG